MKSRGKTLPRRPAAGERVDIITGIFPAWVERVPLPPVISLRTTAPASAPLLAGAGAFFGG